MSGSVEVVVEAEDTNECLSYDFVDLTCGEMVLKSIEGKSVD